MSILPFSECVKNPRYTGLVDGPTLSGYSYMAWSADDLICAVHASFTTIVVRLLHATTTDIAPSLAHLHENLRSFMKHTYGVPTNVPLYVYVYTPAHSSYGLKEWTYLRKTNTTILEHALDVVCVEWWSVI